MQDDASVQKSSRVIQVEGPGWCAPGVTDRSSRNPLGVEAPVLRMANVLVPGISTLSSSARHFALYWALAQHCGLHALDASACKTMINRAEAALAWASLVNPDTEAVTGPATMHGADTVRRVLTQAGGAAPGERVVASY